MGLLENDKDSIRDWVKASNTGIKMLAHMAANPLANHDFEGAVQRIKEMRELMTLDQFTLLLKQIIITLTKRHHKDIRDEFKAVFKKEYKL